MLRGTRDGAPPRVKAGRRCRRQGTRLPVTTGFCGVTLTGRRRRSYVLPAPDHGIAVNTFFITCALTGSAILLLQLVLGIAGVAHDADAHAGHEAIHGGLDLLSVRALSAGLAVFGAGGMLGMQTPLGAVAGLAIGSVLGAAAALGVAWLMRSMLRFEADGSIVLENAVGATAQVYLGIPAARTGAGKVHVIIQGRIVELAAVTAHDAPLPSGASVVVIDVVASDVVEVAPEAAILPTEVLHVAP